jgi:uncharacterized protein (DUF885 family)
MSFTTFVDSYFDALFEWSPSFGTATGVHQYDNQIESFSESAIGERIDRLKQLRQQMSAYLPSALDASQAIDAEILEYQIRAELLELETVRSWQVNPMFYAGVPASAIDILVKRSFAPAKDRLRSVTARLHGVPELLEQMQSNVRNPPKEFTELAIRITKGSADFLEGTVAAWAKDAAGSDAMLQNGFVSANQAALSALTQAATWLEESLLPASNGSFALGPELFAEKLLCEEMVDTPLGELLAIAESNLEKDYRAFVKLAHEVDATKSPAEVMAWISEDHPTPESLIRDAQLTVEGIVEFIEERGIVTIPSAIRPSIVEAPPYLRSYGFAFMDTPGAYEDRATEAFYYVTPPEPEWDAKQTEEHLRQFNRPAMEIITVHEAYPGHYIQFLYAPQFPTKTRKILSCGSNVEGWAHYTEQMMVEEGYRSGNPKILLAQLHEALIRDARFVAGIRLHTSGWSVERAAAFFEERAFQEPANALSEAQRGTYNPTYGYYTLGKLLIYDVREEFRRIKGDAYSLRNFHDWFVRQGGIPIPMLRKLLA